MLTNATKLFITVLLTLTCSFPAAADRVQLGGVTLDFTVPAIINGYDYVPIDCHLTGKGNVTVQALATEIAAHSRFFDSAIPHKVGFRVDYLSENGENATVRITNTGNTVWKAAGHGSVSIAPFGAFSSDIAPGVSVEKTTQISKLLPEEGKNDQRKFVLAINRDDNRRLPDGVTRIEMTIDNCSPGRSATKQIVMDATPRYDSFDEFSHAYDRLKLDGESANAKLKVLVPPWSDRLVVRLIEGGTMRSATLPLNLSEESLKLGGKPNSRWTLDGKPIFVISNVRTEEIAGLSERLGGSNVVIACRRLLDPNSTWLKAIKDNGYKIMPVSMAYIRLQLLARDMGYELMEGAPAFNIQRVDALDPKFHLAMADAVDRTIENAGDSLYRTTDGKIPMCLSDEQSYGYPFGEAHPTRWGGSSEADVAAFRVWLREKYGTVDELNKAWRYSYKDFEEIDPSGLAVLSVLDYPDPWKEWGPAIEDFDVFRSKIHGEFWARTVAEIKKRHPDAICGLNVYADFASADEPIYSGHFEWGIKDYRGNTVNWMARRIGCLPDDLMCFDFFVNWNTGSPEAVKKTIEFWRGRGKEVVFYSRSYGKVVLGGDHEIRTHAPLHLKKKGMMVNQWTSFYASLKAAYESGGIPGALNDPGIGSKINEVQRREIEMFNRAITRSSVRER